MVKRVERFVTPYAVYFRRKEQRQHAQTYLGGLMSDLEKKNSESIAYRYDQDRQGLQHFIGAASWDHQPLIEVLVGQVAAEIGDPTGVIVFDPSGFPKQGKDSVGGSEAMDWPARQGRQWTSGDLHGRKQGTVPRKRDRSLNHARLIHSKQKGQSPERGTGR